MPDSQNESLSRRKWFTAGAATSALLAARAQTQPAADRTVGVKTYNIRDFGAKGDGTTLDTAALQAAIDACNSDQGGTVLVPAGVFVIGTVEMKSNVTLHIAAGGQAARQRRRQAISRRRRHSAARRHHPRRRQLGLHLRRQGARTSPSKAPARSTARARSSAAPSRGVPPPSGRRRRRTVPIHLLFHQCQNFTVRDIFLMDCAFHSVRIIQSSFVEIRRHPHPQSRQPQQRRVPFHQRQHVAHQQLRRACARTTPARCSAVASS